MKPLRSILATLLVFPLGCGGDSEACEGQECELGTGCTDSECMTASSGDPQPSTTRADENTEGGTTETSGPGPLTSTGPGDDEAASIEFFMANGQSGAVDILSPGDVTLSWQASEVSDCTASADPPVDGWSGNKPLVGSEDLVVQHDTVLTLECDALTETLDLSYTVQCDPSMYPPGLTMVEDVYANINDGFPFGESTNASFLLNIWNTQFVALSDFSFPVDDEIRRIVFVDAPTSHNHMDSGTVSISACPGDFSEETATCVLPVHNNSTLFISTRDSDPLSAAPGYCRVDPRQTYYINYVTSPDPYGEAPSCLSPDDNNCAMFYSESL